MRILHVATSMGGGAGIAVARLASAQSQAGHDVVVLSRDFSRVEDYCGYFGMMPLASGVLKRGRSRVTTLANRLLTKDTPSLFTPLSAEQSVLRVAEVVSPEILHVHNFYNTLTPASVKALAARFPLTVTLHDERFYTGGCHYAADCTGYVTACKSCPQTWTPTRSIARRTHGQAIGFSDDGVNAQFVSPSDWLAARFHASSVGAALPIFTVRNPLGPVYRAAVLQLDTKPERAFSNQIRIGRLPGKGDFTWMGVLQSLWRLLDPQERSRVSIVSTSAASGSAWPMEETLSPPASEIERAQFWKGLSIGVTTTQVDNYPNVVIESCSTGTPMVVPEIGGAPEAVRLSGGGLITQSAPTAIAQAIAALIQDPGLREAMGRRGLNFFRNSYEDATIVRQYEYIYSRAQKQA